jgi:hypothetical protein
MVEHGTVGESDADPLIGNPEFLPYTRQDVAKVCASFAAFVPFMEPDLP